jgi:hypothetical protein
VDRGPPQRPSADEPLAIRAARREPGRRRFGPAQLLDPGEARTRVPGRLALALGRNGTATATWTNATGSRSSFSFEARVATAPAGRPFTPPVVLDANGTAGGVATDPGGRTVVSWARLANPLDPFPDQVFAALRAPGDAAFGPAEAVSANEQTSAPAPAFEPGLGRPVVLWSARPPGEPGRVLRYAGRNG